MDHSPRFFKLCEDVRQQIHEVSASEVAERLARSERFELIDVREASEYAESRIGGARHLSRGILERDIERAVPDPGAEIVLYCGGGYRSALAADTLQKMGYTHVRSMAGGFREWKSKNLPIES